MVGEMKGGSMRESNQVAAINIPNTIFRMIFIENSYQIINVHEKHKWFIDQRI